MSEEKNTDRPTVCKVCGRTEQDAGPLIRMPDGGAICHGCMQQTIDFTSRLSGNELAAIMANVNPEALEKSGMLPGFNPEMLQNFDPSMLKNFDPSMLSNITPEMVGEMLSRFGIPGMSISFSAGDAAEDEEAEDEETPSEEKLPGSSENGRSEPLMNQDAEGTEDGEGAPGEKQAPNSSDGAENPGGNPEKQPAKPKKKRPQGGFFMQVSPQDIQSLFGRRPMQAEQEEPEELPEIDMKKVPAPHKIYEMLSEYVVGQEKAKKAISVAIYNHYKRLANKDESVEIEKSNMLMIGPTGCGKTFLVQTLAKLLDVPLAIADATSLTEAGYIGDDIESVVTKLLTAAGNDVRRAEQGIIYIDEIDKLARKRNATQRDVSGESVQQGLLKLLEGAEIEVPVGANSKNAMVPLETVNTKNILFICGGAFPDLEDIIKERLNEKSSMGFGADLKDKYDNEKDILRYVQTEDIRKFGMIPEFIGRVPVVFSLQPMTKEMLIRVLKEPKNAILRQYKKLLEMDEVDLEIEDDACELIAEKALKKDTGARALRSIIEEFMLDIMFEIPKDSNIGRVVITREYIEGKGGPRIELRGNV